MEGGGEADGTRDLPSVGVEVGSRAPADTGGDAKAKGAGLVDSHAVEELALPAALWGSPEGWDDSRVLAMAGDVVRRSPASFVALAATAALVGSIPLIGGLFGLMVAPAFAMVAMGLAIESLSSAGPVTLREVVARWSGQLVRYVGTSVSMGLLTLLVYGGVSASVGLTERVAPGAGVIAAVVLGWLGFGTLIRMGSFVHHEVILDGRGYGEAAVRSFRLFNAQPGTMFRFFRNSMGVLFVCHLAFMFLVAPLFLAFGPKAGGASFLFYPLLLVVMLLGSFVWNMVWFGVLVAWTYLYLGLRARAGRLEGGTVPLGLPHSPGTGLSDDVGEGRGFPGAAGPRRAIPPPW